MAKLCCLLAHQSACWPACSLSVASTHYRVPACFLALLTPSPKLLPVSHSYITLPLQPGALLVLSFFLVLFFLLSYLSLVYWPCSVYNFLSMFWTLPDASVLSLIFTVITSLNHTLAWPCPDYTSGAETQEGQAWAPFRVAQPLLTIVSTCLFNKCLLIPSDSWRLPCPPRCPPCWPLSTKTTYPF